MVVLLERNFIFGIPKMTLSNKVNNRCPNKKSDRMTELTEEGEKSFKFCIKYMSSTNRPLSTPTVKAFTWTIVKKASCLTSSIQKQNLEKSGMYNNFKKRNNLTNRKHNNADCGRSRMANVQCTTNTLLCWKKSSMIWSWHRSLKIFLIAISPWLLWTGALVKLL